ncbi:MAG TPA: PDZ domain-containing protein [Streptosporangiaceae bacterium]
MTSAGYLRYPHIHGDLLVFVAGDDVWLAPVSGGGRAWPLTADGAPVSYPRFSPDGVKVAWTSSRDGGPEVYLAGADGSDPTRLTYWGDREATVSGWTPAGEVLAVSAAGEPTYVPWAYAIRPGEAPRRLPFGPVTDLTRAGTATALVTGRFDREPASWKRYRGGTAGRIWVTAAEDQPFTRLLADLPGQFASPMLIGERLAFISDHEGTGNIYSCALDGTDLRRHTDHDGPYARNASTDGERIVYHAAGDIWLLDGLDAPAPRRLEVPLGFPAPGRAPRVVSAADHLGEFDCDRTGLASVVEVRGTIHWLTHKDGPARAIHFDLTTRARLPRVLGRSGGVAYVTSDAGTGDAGTGDVAGDTLWIADGPEASPRPIAAGQIGSVTGIAASPDGSRIAVAAHDGHVRVVDVASGTVTQVVAGGDGPCEGLSWAPDSAWLAWSQLPGTGRLLVGGAGSLPLRQIRLAHLPPSASGQPGTAVAGIIDVTDGRFADTDPVFTLDGQHLAFLSQRSFDPVYDTQSFDMSFPYGSRPFLVPLAAGTPSPFGPLPAGRPVEPASGGARGGPGEPAASGAEGPQGGDGAWDGHDRSLGAGSPADSGQQQRAAGPTVHIDPDGIAARIVAVPVPEARYSRLRAVADGLAWLHEPLSGVLGEGGASPDAPPRRRASLERFDLARRECTELCAELDGFAVSGDGTWAVAADHGEVRVIPAGRKAGDDGSESVSVDLTRARFREDPAQLWRCAYGEAGRIMRRDFWVPDMSGVDWDGVLREYRPLLDRIRTAAEFTDLLEEVFGELGTSHAFVFPPKTAAPGQDPGGTLGKLGADLSRDAGGAWRVDQVLPGESSDPLARSPLAAPGAGVRPGDVLVAVDGQPVDPVHGPAPLLADAAGKPVELTVRSAAATRRVAVVPLHSERRLRYQDWVASRRRHARELSSGRLGYLHVPDMMGAGWAHFNRDLRTEMHYEGLIIDVRTNGGGHISHLVLEKLAQRVIGWDVIRWHQAEPYPTDARRGPLVALANQNSGSDGDLITAAIRLLGLGPVVGTRTWGGLVGYDQERELVDGTQITIPQMGLSLDQLGWGVENYGVDPDVEVDITPADWARGRDPQLETAVRLALEALEKEPAASPPDPRTSPRKARPPLPPRPDPA